MGRWVLWNGWIFICREKYQFGFFNFFACHFCFHEYFRTCDVLISHYISFFFLSISKFLLHFVHFDFFPLLSFFLFFLSSKNWSLIIIKIITNKSERIRTKYVCIDVNFLITVIPLWKLILSNDSLGFIVTLWKEINTLIK